jgi:hypothetical protein
MVVVKDDDCADKKREYILFASAISYDEVPLSKKTLRSKLESFLNSIEMLRFRFSEILCELRLATPVQEKPPAMPGDIYCWRT